MPRQRVRTRISPQPDARLGFCNCFLDDPMRMPRTKNPADAGVHLPDHAYFILSDRMSCRIFSFSLRSGMSNRLLKTISPVIRQDHILRSEHVRSVSIQNGPSFVYSSIFADGFRNGVSDCFSGRVTVHGFKPTWRTWILESRR